MRRLIAVLAAAVVAVLVLGFVGVSFVHRSGGPLDKAGNGFGGPVQAGHPFSAMYDLINDGGRTIEVERVALAKPPTGVTFLGARVQTGGPGLGAMWPGFPPARVDSVPAKSFVLAPHAHVPLLVGLRTEQTGKYRLAGIDVDYRVRYFGHIGPRYRRTVTTEMAFCAQRLPIAARARLCAVPSFSE